MKAILLLIGALAVSALQVQAVAPFPEFVDPNPNPGNQFGHSVVPLITGNVVITSPYDDAGGADAGAVYLFDGATGALISSLTGSSAGDNVGDSGVTALPNGNYVVRSSNWANGTATGAGAVTWASGLTGVSGPVSPANSLVGSSHYDRVGSHGVTALTNGDFIVSSSFWDNGTAVDAGAVTWASGVTGVSGPVSPGNSLVGSSIYDNVGGDGVTALTNGNYVVASRDWDNGIALNAGAVTWGNGSSGITGPITISNSLVGSNAYDFVGGVTALTNGHYVVNSPSWQNGPVTDAGAVTWGDGSTGITGPVATSNSLVGTTQNDLVGLSVIALHNGHYVIQSFYWDSGTVVNAGAVTWSNGASGITGSVSPGNSLVGISAYDQVGDPGVTVLPNGNYVVSSSQWNNGTATRAGAVTWGNGLTGITGPVTTSNSLVGTAKDDYVGRKNGSNRITALPNGNYVVISPLWAGDTSTGAGAVTWGNGTTGITGAIDASNSLVGSDPTGDEVGSGGVTVLTNGNYVIASPNWDNGTSFRAGAVTWGDGTTGITGHVSPANSLVGNNPYYSDKVGSGGVTVLTNGHYVVISPVWNNGFSSNSGAVTWGNGTTGITGPVTSSNSLVGSIYSEQVGSGGVTALSNGHYVVSSPLWDTSVFPYPEEGILIFAGAVTWGNGATGTSGLVSPGNSLVGSTNNDFFGGIVLVNHIMSGVTPLSNGNYLVRAPHFDNGTLVDAGAVTWGNGNCNCGARGTLTPNNSLLGEIASPGLQEVVLDNLNQTFLVRFLHEANGKVRVGSQVDGFGTLPTAPVVANPTNDPLTPIAHLGGEVVSDGGDPITERGIIIDLASAGSDPIPTGTRYPAPGTTGIFTVPVSLSPGAEYRFRAYAINCIGTSYTSIVTFTLAGGPPSVTTLAPTSVTPTKATLRATVDPNQVQTTVTFYVGGIAVGSVIVPAGTEPTTVSYDYNAGIIPGQSITYSTSATNLANQTGTGSELDFDLMSSDATLAEGNSHLWGANIGWINGRPATHYGFHTGDTVCSGFLWGANIGWIHAGTGEPSNGIRYSNTGSDYGVNVMPDGTLRGYAWGQNIGWISFENTGNPAIDLATGALTGHAWSANVGWIVLDTYAAATTHLAILDTDHDGISDAWENERANGNLATLGTPGDADGDGQSDLAEFAADTDPRDSSDQLRVLSFTRGQLYTDLVFTSRPTRFYQVTTHTGLSGEWTNVGIGDITGEPATTLASFPTSTSPHRFYRVEAKRPLAAP